ncbi:hypothetical protein LINPERHAP2_LOCUS33515 [Linum perenne]
MGVNVVYHVGGQFKGTGPNFCYVGGDILSIPDVDPDMINAFDLEVRLQSQVRNVEKVNFYYKKPMKEGVDAYQVIVNDYHIRDLCDSYKGRDVYDIYVERVGDGNNVEANENDGESDEYDSDFAENEFDNESEESEFEMGSWISEEDLEDVQQVRKKVQAAKEKLKKGVHFLCNHNGDVYESDGVDSDEIGYHEEVDSDNETQKTKSPYLRYNRNTDKPYFETTMTFSSMSEVRTAIKKHAITERRDVKWVKNDPTRVRLACKWKGCNWMFFASINKRFNLVQLKSYVEHVCPEHYKNKFVTPRFIATHYKERIKSNPRWKIRHMRETIRADFGCDVSVMQCSRAKSKVLRTTFAAYKEEYAILRTYAEELLRVNPGSSVKIMVNTDNPTSEPYFQRMCVCFDSLKRGFLAGCRRFISLEKRKMVFVVGRGDILLNN